MAWWVLPLIQAGMGVARGIYEHQQKDPSEAYRRSLRERSGTLQRQSRVDVASPQIGNVRSAAANRAYGAQAQNVAGGRGSSTLQPTLSQIDRGAGMDENQILRWADERRTGLIDRAAGFRGEAAGMADQWKAQKKSRVVSGVAGGLVSAAGSTAEHFNPVSGVDYDPYGDLSPEQLEVLKRYQTPQMPN